MFPFRASTQPNWSFQTDAVSAVVRGFEQNMRSRMLLVIPTGGGKTATALRSIEQLRIRGLLGPEKRVLWIVHTLALRAQATDLLGDEVRRKRFGLSADLVRTVDVCMKSDATRRLQERHRYALIVIDEAHHSAAKSYLGYFEHPLGVLGLTATPRRTDDIRLPFDKVAYSITFRDLVRRQVVLLPTFLPEEQTSLTLDITDLTDPVQLAKFNTKNRNRHVVDIIFREAARHGLSKLVVFVPTNEHVVRLFEELRAHNDGSEYQFAHIGYIYGGDNNDRGESNEDYLRWHKTQRSSLVVNCQILCEGYDDPSLDSIVMATPTNSILYYMQCIGRVVRNPGDDGSARAFVIEIADNLPNVSYRIDNRWLFAELSDFLEPTIYDIKGWAPLRLFRLLYLLLFGLPQRSVLDGFAIVRSATADLSPSERKSLLFGSATSLLLFNDVPDNPKGVWRALPVPELESECVDFFNDWSERIDEYYTSNYEYLFDRDYSHMSARRALSNRPARASFVGALHRASLRKLARLRVDSLIYISIR